MGTVPSICLLRIAPIETTADETEAFHRGRSRNYAARIHCCQLAKNKRCHHSPVLVLRKLIFSRSGVEINFSDVNIVTEVEHFLPREQIFANICSLGSFHFFDSCDKNLIVLSRQLLIPLNSSQDDNSFVIIFLFLKFEIFVLFLLPTVKKIVYILLERMLIFPSVLCSPRASPSGYKLHLRKNHAFLSLNI
jgi:hypothetical protein